MEHFKPAPDLSEKAKEILTEFAKSGSTEQSGVANILNVIGWNGAEMSSNESLIGNAREIIESAQAFISRLTGITDNHLKVPVLVYQKKETSYSLTASTTGDADIYKEMAVSINRRSDGVCVADIYFSATEDGEPKVLVTTDGEGDGDHNITIYPLRPIKEAVVEETS